MGFFSGRVTFARYKVNGPAPHLFGEEYLERLAAHQAGRQRLASADGVEVGWTAGDHVLDTRFDLAKNVINDTLHFELRIDVDRLPGDLMKAYYQVELLAQASVNPGGRPNARQKREAKEAARDRLEQEAKDGRFKKRKCIPVLWDRLTNEVLFGTASLTHYDRLSVLFQNTFGQTLDVVTAGRRAYALAEPHDRTRGVDDAGPSAFVPGVSPSDVAWIVDETSRDFLGNEFLLWLWYVTDAESDAIKLADDSELVIMPARTLTLECPRGQTGFETITSEGPTRLPEARRAVQSGKLPRKLGLTLVRHDAQYEFTLHAETLAVASAKLPAVEGELDERGRLDERANQIRHLTETVDLLYDAFGRFRFGGDWSKELTKMQRWLQREERRAA
jgi:hypothetical protein